LITRIIISALDEGTFSLQTFYFKRIRRIFPALIAMLTVVLTAGALLLFADEYKLLSKHAMAGVAFISNIIFWTESGYFEVASSKKPLLHLWSLGIEEQFYLLWPVLLLLAHKLRLNKVKLTFTLLVLSFILNVYFVKKYPTATFYLPHTRIWELLFGALLSML